MHGTMQYRIAPGIGLPMQLQRLRAPTCLRNAHIRRPQLTPVASHISSSSGASCGSSSHGTSSSDSASCSNSSSTCQGSMQDLVGQLQAEAGAILGACNQLEEQYRAVQQMQEAVRAEAAALAATEHLYCRREDTAREQAALLEHAGPGAVGASLQAAAASSPPGVSLALVAEALAAEQQRLAVKVGALRRRRLEMSFLLSPCVEELPPEEVHCTTSSRDSNVRTTATTTTSSSSMTPSSCSEAGCCGVTCPNPSCVCRQLTAARSTTRAMYATILRHSAAAAYRHRTRVAVLTRVPALQRVSGGGMHQDDCAQSGLCGEVEHMLASLGPLQGELAAEMELFQQAHQQEVAAAAACRHTLMSALHRGEAQLEGLLRALQEQLGAGGQQQQTPPPPTPLGASSSATH